MSDEVTTSTQIPRRRRLVRCQRHDTDCRFWCDTCKVLVCVHCMGVSHSLVKNHDVKELDEAVEMHRMKVIETRTQAKLSLRYIRQKRESILDSRNQAEQAVHNAVKNSLSSVEKSLGFMTDESLDPSDIIQRSKSMLTSDHHSDDVSKLEECYRELSIAVSYLQGLRDAVDRKHQESEALSKSHLMFAMIRPDCGEIYCVQCGSLCSNRRAKSTDEDNPFRVEAVLHECSKCRVTIGEFFP